jgi:hypothetical protein
MEAPRHSSPPTEIGCNQNSMAPYATNDRPWRLADLTFVPSGAGGEKAEIKGIVVVRQNGRYSISTRQGPQWTDIDEQSFDPALNYLFNLWVQKGEPQNFDR